MAFSSTVLIRFDNDEENEGEGKDLNKPVELLNLDFQEQQLVRRGPEIELDGVEEEDGGNAPLRYVPLCDVYSATSPCVSSASGGSKKVKPPRKSMSQFNGHDLGAKSAHQVLSSMEVVRDSDNSRANDAGDAKGKPPITKVYTRRNKGKRKERVEGQENPRSRGVILGNCKENGEENGGIAVENGELNAKKGKRRKVGGYELANLGVDLIASSNSDRLPSRESRRGNDVNTANRNRNPSVQDANPNKIRKRKPKGETQDEIKDFEALRTKRWVW